VRVLTAGETMVLLDGVGGGLTLGAPFQLRIGGAESNFAVALCRLGITTTWVSRVGADSLGDFLLGLLEAEGVDLRFVRREPDAPTGVFFKWHENGESRVLYRRAGSAASHLEPGDLPDEAFEGVAVVHLTGITSALSDGAHRTVVKAAAEAKRRGLVVTFDPNYRPALWGSPRQAAARQREVLPYVDHYLCGEAEGNLLFEAGTLETLRESALRAGVGEVVVRVGARGAVVWEEGSMVVVPPTRIEQVVDEIGAGDGFAAGYVFGLLHGWASRDSARAGNLIAARALLGTGDWETYPRLAEIAGELDL
jgi:2-dehydro-3-deoxygluconokinase